MKNKWLIVILLIASFFRFFRLTASPPALNWDEVSIGYNAYSVLKTGRDEWGEFLPLSFKAFGEHKLPGMIYASIPGILFFGTTDFGVRVTPAVIGVLGILVIYLLAKRIFKSELVGLTSAFLLSISPWGVHFSRVSFEAGLAMVLMMGSIYFLLNLKNKPQDIWFSLLFAVIAAYTYNSIRILLPLMFIAYLLNRTIEIRKIPRRLLVVITLAAVILLSPLVIGLTRSEERVRLGTVSITSQKSFIDDIAVSRGYTTLPSILPRLIHNKLTHYAFALGENYIELFGTNFLFLEGGTNTQRSVQGMGLLHLFELPLLIAGLAIILGKKSPYPQAKKILLPWLLLAGIPSIITIDSPSTVRALNLLPALLLIEGVGFSHLYKQYKGHIAVLIAYFAFAFWSILYFAYQLWLVYPVKYSDSWQYGYKQAIQFAHSHYQSADLIFLPARYGEPYIYTLFYTGFDPSTYHKIIVSQEVDPTGWVHNRGFDKYRFSDYSGLETPEEIVARNSGKLVLITGFATLPGEYERVFEVKAPNWKVMFEAAVMEGEQ